MRRDDGGRVVASNQKNHLIPALVGSEWGIRIARYPPTQHSSHVAFILRSIHPTQHSSTAAVVTSSSHCMQVMTVAILRSPQLLPSSRRTPGSSGVRRAPPAALRIKNHQDPKSPRLVPNPSPHPMPLQLALMDQLSEMQFQGVAVTARQAYRIGHGYPAVFTRQIHDGG